MEQGDISWCSFPPPNRTRPVLVLTRTNALRYLTSVTVPTLTSVIRQIASEPRGAGSGRGHSCGPDSRLRLRVPRARRFPRPSGVRIIGLMADGSQLSAVAAVQVARLQCILRTQLG